MIHFVQGDMFSINADILVNTVNAVGVMGAGVALAFKTRYPEMYKDYRAACFRGELGPGTLHIWRSDKAIIVNFPTKRHWRDGSRYEDIQLGLKSLKSFLLTQGLCKVSLPALGCGLGGLDFDRVKAMISTELSGLEADIYVFSPDDSRSVR